MLVSINYVKSYNHNNMINAIKDINKNTKIRMDIEATTINDDKRRVVIISEYFNSNKNIDYPLMEGRYYNFEEVENAEKVVLVGKNYRNNVFKYENKDSIYIDGQLYEVIGIVGENNKSSVWDDNIFMPMTALTSISLESFENLFFSKIYVSNNEFKEGESD